MKTITRSNIVVILGFLLAWSPADGFNLSSKFSNVSDKLSITDTIVDKVGDLMYAIKLKSCNLCKTTEELKFVETVWAKLVKVAPQCDFYKAAKAKNWQWKVSVVDDRATADAEAFPGGKVLVYSGICAITGNDQAKMAYVLSHEMAHALARHAKSRFDKQTKKALISAASAGTLNAAGLDPKVTLGAMSAIGVAYGKAVVVPFSKDQEIEADHIALMIMAQAGFDPEASLKFLEKQNNLLNKNTLKIKRSSQDDHPPIEKRAANLKQHFPEAMKIYQKNRG
ncbi:MAG: M48 family metallopeptidase [Desulfobacteraceae bacterium]|jgi:predicted Zn-dependent protease